MVMSMYVQLYPSVFGSGLIRRRRRLITKIRHVSDDHVPSLSPNSGHWKVGTIHRARVIGFQAVDGIFQLSLQQSVLEQKFLQVADVEVGELLKVS